MGRKEKGCRKLRWKEESFACKRAGESGVPAQELFHTADLVFWTHYRETIPGNLHHSS